MSQTLKRTFEPDYAVPPGETLLEKIQDMGMSQADLSLRLGLSEKHISQVINGIAPITQETAIGLERVTGVSATFWNNREAIYRERAAHHQDAKRLSGEVEALEQVPLVELIDRGFVTEKQNKTVQLQQVLSFFGVSSTSAMFELWKSEQAAARKSKAFESHPGCTATWLRMGAMEAQKVVCRDFDRARFTLAVSKIRSLTVAAPEVFVPAMGSLCAAAGVAMVLIPEIRGARWYGASWWATPRKAVIELNLRGKKDDQFFFSFFHEAGHILTHGKKDVYINDGRTDDPLEEKANEFAATVLIPPDHRRELRAIRTENDILRLAKSLCIAPGIVVGQYQHETRHFYKFNNLKRTFIWAA